jgi:histidinol-phosphatase (PHP family)
MILKDGHVHTMFCPHGSNDTFEKYIERAMSLGLEEISFTEHAPLPIGFVDTTPTNDSAMGWTEIEEYFREIHRVKELYKGKIVINRGLEVDFIEGYEKEIKESLNKLGPYLDDAILSVHFLKKDDKYDCLDYSPQVFSEMIQSYGSLERVYQKYYETVLLSIRADLGTFKPKRIGHITLVHKFQKKFPYNGDEKPFLLELLKEIKTNGYSLDYNGAGTRKPLCREAYPPNWVIEEAVKLNIPLVYGSDAHQAKELGQGMDQMCF